MSTRKLILTALVCGLVIIVAGGVKLFQVASDTKRVEVLQFGTTAQLSDMTVSVVAINQTEQATLATVTMVGVEGADAAEGWRLLADGAVRTPIEATDINERCLITSATISRTCVVAFAPSDGTVTVAYIRAGAQSQWSSSLSS